jgi:thiol-disulfide isomerase/thioredoxin
LSVPAQPGASTTPKKAELQVVKHAELVKAIQAYKGKVVLVAFWASYHAPSKELFPLVAKLQEKHRGQGLMCLTVSIDPTSQKWNGKERILKFLNRQETQLVNFWVQDSDACEDHWNFIGITTFLLFDKTGKLARRFNVIVEGESTTEDLEQAVAKQLK